MTPIDPAFVTHYVDQARATIAEHGWAVQHVQGNRPIETFAFTLGLTRQGRQELWVGSMGSVMAKRILNILGRQLMLGGLPVGSPFEVDGWSVPFLLRGPVDLADAGVWAPFGLVLPDDRVEVLQVCWPDGAGRFPGDAAYDVTMPQRVLQLAPAEPGWSL